MSWQETIREKVEAGLACRLLKLNQGVLRAKSGSWEGHFEPVTVSDMFVRVRGDKVAVAEALGVFRELGLEEGMVFDKGEVLVARARI